MTDPCRVPVSGLVAHTGSMCLLSRLLSCDAERVVAEVDIRADGIFHDDDGVGGWVGLEYMAQTVAAWAGWQARGAGKIPRIGYLLGTRRYECACAHFLPGDTLRVTATRIFQSDNGLGQFECTLSLRGHVVANATLTVFGPGEDSMAPGGD